MNDTRSKPNLEPIGPPQPNPFPFPEPLRPVVSGRYEGGMTAPSCGRYSLDLRVDIDSSNTNSPVMDRVSGDVYEVFRISNRYAFRIYRESWIANTLSVNWSGNHVEITGRIHYWQGGHPDTDVHIVIPYGRPVYLGPANVTFTEAGGNTSSYICYIKSYHFREVTLEVDVCDSVNTEPILPSFNTHAHSNRPVDLPQRTLNIEEAYREAGIDLTINPARTIIDDSAAEFNTWSPAELHDAMEQYFSQSSGSWPKWHTWCLLAGEFDDPLVGGLMFDAAARFGGAGEPPERQGCAVFRNHSWFNDLVASPTNDDEAWAMRQYLYTYVHEIGHGFNFLHSWDKRRPDALSWMNYDWRYDIRNGADSFWANFRFRFDDEELIHLRHGNRSEVIPGGDPWASGSHLETPIGAMADLVGKAPVEFFLRSKSYFQFMEPVIIELRIRNITDIPLELDTQLNPEFGSVIVYIRRPDGRTLKYAPILCKVATSEPKVLKPLPEAITGEDRYSQNVFLSYGTYGYYFDEPGDYLVRAFYQGQGNLLIPSNVHRLRIGRPTSSDEDRIAQKFFTYETGMALYLNGSSSPYLEKGMETMKTIVEKYKESQIGAYMSFILAQNLAKPFFRIEKGKLVKSRSADLEKALDLTKQAKEQQKLDNSTFTNISYHHLCRTRADLMAAMGKEKNAKKELNELVEDLKKGGVNQPVLDEIKEHAKSL